MMAPHPFLFPAFNFRFITKTSFAPWPQVSEALCWKTFTWTAACCCCKLHHGLSLLPVDWGQLQGHQHVCSRENGANWERSRLPLRHKHAMKVFRVCTVNIYCVKKHEVFRDLSRAGRARYTESEQTAIKVLFSFSPRVFGWGCNWTCWFLVILVRWRILKSCENTAWRWGVRRSCFLRRVKLCGLKDCQRVALFYITFFMYVKRKLGWYNFYKKLFL